MNANVSFRHYVLGVYHVSNGASIEVILIMCSFKCLRTRIFLLLFDFIFQSLCHLELPLELYNSNRCKP